MRLGGQIRTSGGMAPVVLGWDMTAALALGGAMGISPCAAAEFLPDLERVMASKLNERAREHDGGN